MRFTREEHLSFLDAEQEEEAGVNLTPLIDIVFLLLVFFMLTSRFDTQKSLELELPTASNAATKEIKEPLLIELSQTGELSLKGEKTPIDELKSRLTTLTKTDSKPPSAILRADKDAEHGQVVRVLDILTEAGVRELSVAAK